MNLSDVMPKEFISDYADVRAYKYRDVRVVAEHYTHHRRWVGPEKNVHFWVELENGYAVAWNENPSRGWSFPVFKLKKKARGDL